MPPRRTRNSPMKTPWDKPKERKSVGQEIRETREWLMITYGGRWGRLQLAAERADALEDRMVALRIKVKDLEAERRARIN